MADTTRADVMSYLEKANMVEISELISEIEEKFGVTAAAPVAAARNWPQLQFNVGALCQLGALSRLFRSHCPGVLG